MLVIVLLPYPLSLAADSTPTYSLEYRSRGRRHVSPTSRSLSPLEREQRETLFFLWMAARGGGGRRPAGPWGRGGAYLMETGLRRRTQQKEIHTYSTYIVTPLRNHAQAQIHSDK
jgi:hypothetical protein